MPRPWPPPAGAGRMPRSQRTDLAAKDGVTRPLPLRYIAGPVRPGHSNSGRKPDLPCQPRAAWSLPRLRYSSPPSAGPVRPAPTTTKQQPTRLLAPYIANGRGSNYPRQGDPWGGPGDLPAGCVARTGRIGPPVPGSAPPGRGLPVFIFRGRENPAPPVVRDLEGRGLSTHPYRFDTWPAKPCLAIPGIW